MTGQVWIGNTLYPNTWVPTGKTIHLIICPLCNDSGELRDDNNNYVGPCDCWRGEDGPQ